MFRRKAKQADRASKAEQQSGLIALRRCIAAQGMQARERKCLLRLQVQRGSAVSRTLQDDRGEATSCVEVTEAVDRQSTLRRVPEQAHRAGQATTTPTTDTRCSQCTADTDDTALRA